MESKEINQVYQEADCLYNRVAVEQALDRMAQAMTMDLHDKNPLILCVMTGGIIPMGQLLTRLDFPLQIDYVHASRYRGETSGGKLHWMHHPAFSLKHRNVVLVDDILDEGITLDAIIEYCWEEGANDVKSAVLVNKLHERKNHIKADYVGLDVEDRYLFGFGMDYHDYLRNAAGIYAVKGM